MDLKQIAQKLNEEFNKSEVRKLIFWYDADAEFVDDVDSLELNNAKLYKLEKDNQFYTKYFLECEDTTTNYLMYAPFPKPNTRENHLADMVKYSKEFFADRASIICLDLGIPSELKPIIEKHKKFFNAAVRYSKFFELRIDKFDEQVILIGIMSVICKVNTASFEEVLRTVLMESTENDNKYMAEIEKYGLSEAFWSLCNEKYGYQDATPSISRLAIAFFITYTQHFLNGDIPKSWSGHRAYKSGSVVAFMSNTMNNSKYLQAYDDLSNKIAAEISAKKHLSEIPLDRLLECDAFEIIDELIIKWINENLVSENIRASLAGNDIPAVVSIRCSRHYADKFRNVYEMLVHAYGIIKVSNYICPDKLDKIIDHYRDYGFLIDTNYRMFYCYFDRLDKTGWYETLRERVENIYTNEYLDKLTVNFTNALIKESVTDHIPLQRNFYRRYIANIKERVIVIISDALRYEVAHELWRKMEDDEKCSAQPFMMLGVLPSITKLGMASLLPHNKLELTDDFKVMVDGKPCESTSQREVILQAEKTDSRCVLFDEVVAAKREKVREIFANKDVVYVYHNQIDARGDKASTENEVFAACNEAIEEIYKMIRKLTEEVSARHFIITSDHGFIYKRDKIHEYDKIDGLAKKENLVGKRYIISESEIKAEGVKNFDLSTCIGNTDTRKIYIPSGTSIFKTQGGGQNYVHGGASPQEMLIPMIDVKTYKGRQETRPVTITLISTTTKVTSLIQSFEFFQAEPVTDVVKSAKYRLSFVSDDGESISNEVLYEADSKDTDSARRLTRIRFTFKNRRYGNNNKYYLVAYLEPKNDYQEPIFKHQVIMDIAFADDFGF